MQKDKEYESESVPDTNEKGMETERVIVSSKAPGAKKKPTDWMPPYTTKR